MTRVASPDPARGSGQPTRLGRGVLLVLAALVLGSTGRVRAQGFQDVSLSWARVAGAEQCIGAHALALLVQQRIGHPIWVATGDAELSVEGYVRPLSPEGFEALVVTAKPTGEIVGRRELRTRSSDCHSLDASLALVIALTIDPEAGFVNLPDVIESTDDSDLTELLATPVPDEQAQADPGAAAPENPAPASADAAASEEAPPEDEGPQRTHGPHLSAGIGGGYAPGVNGALSVGYMGSRKQWRVGAESRFWLPGSDTLGGATYRMSGAQLSLYGCPLWGFTAGGSLEGQLCAGATPGLTVVRAVEGERRTLASFEIDLISRVLLRTASRFTPYLGLHLGFVVYGTRLAELVDSVPSTLWETPPVRGGVSFGVLLRL